MSVNVYGDTSNLKASQARSLDKFAARQLSPEQIVGPTLAKDLLTLSRELNRQLGLFIDRRGRVERVIVGDAHALELPEFTRVRGADGRLRGVRLLLTHLLPEALNREELADLAKLRLDCIAAIHDGPSGIQVDLAMLGPSTKGDAFTVRTWPRAPLAILNRLEDPRIARDGLPVPLDLHIREAETALVAATTTAREERSGTRALALMVHRGGPETDTRAAELKELCRTSGVHLLEIVKQRRQRADSRTYFGKGKLREVLIYALEQDAEVLICDTDLSPSQAKEIAAQTDLKVIDRTMLILDIFAQHAQSSDGKLQVELAQLRYRLPRMVGRGTMMSRLAGGIGGRGPGESKLEIDRRRAQSRITELERRLANMQKRRNQRRAQRRRANVPVVAIVGYTNAGKSTLLNTVTQSEVRAENLLFATLDPTVRRVRFPREREIVMLDTVGFIRELPPALMQAFGATLEEVSGADLLLHVVDLTDPDQTSQIQTVEHILEELDAADIPRFIVFNKCDALGDATRSRDTSALGATPPDAKGLRRFFISAVDRRSTRELMEAIEAQIWGPAVRGRVRSSTLDLPGGEPPESPSPPNDGESPQGAPPSGDAPI